MIELLLYYAGGVLGGVLVGYAIGLAVARRRAARRQRPLRGFLSTGRGQGRLGPPTTPRPDVTPTPQKDRP